MRPDICIDGIGPPGELGPVDVSRGYTMGGWNAGCGCGETLGSPDERREPGESGRCDPVGLGNDG
jgi:hypothetical protein